MRQSCLVSRNAMMQRLLGMESGDQVLFFVRLFHGTPSTFFWENTMGDVHHILEGKANKEIH